jgi:LPXTG-motif cell wall-anchored protein
MRRNHNANKGNKSPLLLIMGLLFLFGAIFTFFREKKKDRSLVEMEEEDKQNPKDFI